MGQVNVNPGPTTVVSERSGSGMMVGLLVGLLLLVVLGWYLFTQTSMFGGGPAPRPATGGNTSVNVTNNPAPSGGQTGSTTGSQPGR